MDAVGLSSVGPACLEQGSFDNIQGADYIYLAGSAVDVVVDVTGVVGVVDDDIAVAAVLVNAEGGLCVGAGGLVGFVAVVAGCALARPGGSASTVEAAEERGMGGGCAPVAGVAVDVRFAVAHVDSAVCIVVVVVVVVRPEKGCSLAVGAFLVLGVCAAADGCLAVVVPADEPGGSPRPSDQEPAAVFVLLVGIVVWVSGNLASGAEREA